MKWPGVHKPSMAGHDILRATCLAIYTQKNIVFLCDSVFFQMLE